MISWRHNRLFRLLTAVLSLPFLSFSAVPAAGEIPQTTAEWLDLYNHRRNNTYSVKLECTWQTLENGKLLEEWDQVVQLDDFGGKRIEEFGRVRTDRPPSKDRTLVDSIYAFDGNEYRELTTVWRVVDEKPLTRESKATLRAQPSASGGWIEVEPGEMAAINEAQTPLKLADYWFANCLTGALKEGLDPRSVPVAGRPGVWEVSLDSQDENMGHKCRAIVNEAQDNRLERLDLWHQTDWRQTCTADYVYENGRWRMASGALVRRGPREATGPAREVEQRVTVRAATYSGPSAGEIVALPVFPEGTTLSDRRTGATYRVGADASAEAAVADLAAEGREKTGALAVSVAAHRRWLEQLRLTFRSAGMGAVVGIIVTQVARIGSLAWRAYRSRAATATHDSTRSANVTA